MTFQHRDMFLDAHSSSSGANWELEEPSHTHTFKEMPEFQERVIHCFSQWICWKEHIQGTSGLYPPKKRDFYRPKWRFRAKKTPHPVVFDVGWVLGSPLRLCLPLPRLHLALSLAELLRCSWSFIWNPLWSIFLSPVKTVKSCNDR